MTLSEFMQARELDDDAMGLKLNKSRVTISRYRRGLEVPPPPVIVQIVEISEGQVTANEILGIQPDVSV